MGQKYSSFQQGINERGLMRLSEVQLQNVRKLFTFGNQNKIQLILMAHPHLAQLLPEIYQHLIRYFPDSKILLDATVDPEEATNPYYLLANEELILSVSTHLNPNEALQTMEQFYDDWWFSELDGVRDKISIGLELV